MWEWNLCPSERTRSQVQLIPRLPRLSTHSLCCFPAFTVSEDRKSLHFYFDAASIWPLHQTLPNVTNPDYNYSKVARLLKTNVKENEKMKICIALINPKEKFILSPQEQDQGPWFKVSFERLSPEIDKLGQKQWTKQSDLKLTTKG